MSESTPTPIPKRKPRDVRLSTRLREHFYEFVANTSLARLNRLSRDMLLAYLKDDTHIATYFFESKDYRDLQMLFYLFEIIEEEYKGDE
jgi:hypothetical protein